VFFSSFGGHLSNVMENHIFFTPNILFLTRQNETCIDTEKTFPLAQGVPEKKFKVQQQKSRQKKFLRPMNTKSK